LSGIEIKVDIKEVVKICKKHMTEKEWLDARKELSEYVNRTVLEAQGFADQVLGHDE
jgi:hypothetical protein